MPTELERVAEGRFRIVWRLTGALAASVVLIAALVYALAASNASDHAQEAVAGSCQFYRDISSVPITEKSSTALLTIIADARVAYDIAGCDRTKGVLPKPDPKVVPYLPKGLR